MSRVKNYSLSMVHRNNKLNNNINFKISCEKIHERHTDSIYVRYVSMKDHSKTFYFSDTPMVYLMTFQIVME